MLLKFREDKIHRNEALVQGKLPVESYLLEENKALSEEIELLRARVDNNPEVTRFALENIRLSNQLKMYVQCRSACTSQLFFTCNACIHISIRIHIYT